MALRPPTHPPTRSWAIFDFILELGITSFHPIIPTVDWRSNRHRLDEELLPSFADDQKASQTAGFSRVKELPSRELVAPTTHHYVTDLKIDRPLRLYYRWNWLGRNNYVARFFSSWKFRLAEVRPEIDVSSQGLFLGPSEVVPLSPQ